MLFCEFCNFNSLKFKGRDTVVSVTATFIFNIALHIDNLYKQAHILCIMHTHIEQNEYYVLLWISQER